MLEPADQENLNGMPFAADTEKAFDSVYCSVLQKFGFGLDFVQWVKTMFCNAQSCVMNNGN